MNHGLIETTEIFVNLYIILNTFILHQFLIKKAILTSFFVMRTWFRQRTFTTQGTFKINIQFKTFWKKYSHFIYSIYPLLMNRVACATIYSMKHSNQYRFYHQIMYCLDMIIKRHYYLSIRCHNKHSHQLKLNKRVNVHDQQFFCNSVYT